MEDPIDQASSVSLQYTWAINNDAQINPGDTVTVTVPEGFRIGNDLGGQLVTTDVYSVGDWKLTKETRQLQLTFNENASTLLDVTGTVQINTRFELDNVGVSNPVEFRFPISGGVEKTIRVKFKPENVTNPIEKRGEPNRSLNPEKITWTIDVNKTLEHVADGTVTDSLPEGLSYLDGSLKV